jgi:hypothetical protein
MKTLLELFLKEFEFLYLDSRYRITDSKTGGEKTNSSLTVTSEVLTWFLATDRGQTQLSVAPTELLTPRNWFWVSLIRQLIQNNSEIEYLPAEKEIDWARNNLPKIEQLFSQTSSLESTCETLRALRSSNADKYWGPAEGHA